MCENTFPKIENIFYKLMDKKDTGTQGSNYYYHGCFIIEEYDVIYTYISAKLCRNYSTS